MKKHLILLCLFLSLPSFASLDDQLKTYIEKFNYKSPVLNEVQVTPLFELGRQLFFSQKLSLAGDISCAHCHHPVRGTGDRMPLSIGTGFDGDITFRTQGNAGVTKRHAPALWNRGLDHVKFHFWDGRVGRTHRSSGFSTPSIFLNGTDPKLKDVVAELTNVAAAQSLFPPTSEVEMKGPYLIGEDDETVWNAITENVLKDEGMKIMFELAFPGVDSFNMGHIGKAIAHFEKFEFFVNDTPWDQYLQGNLSALTEKEKRGAIIFSDKAKCARCHFGDRLNNDNFANIMIADIGIGKAPKDMGRYEVTQKDTDKYKFLTPGLRNISLSAPYMHNGIFNTLEDVVLHYNHPMRTLMHFEASTLDSIFGKLYNDKFVRDWNRENMKEIFDNRSANLEMNLRLTREEFEDLVYFLRESLTSPKWK